MRQYAIIRRSKVQYEDHYAREMWWFDVDVSDSGGALMVEPLSSLVDALEAFNVAHPADLNGKPCLVEYDQMEHLIRYLGPAK